MIVVQVKPLMKGSVTKKKLFGEEEAVHAVLLYSPQPTSSRCVLATSSFEKASTSEDIRKTNAASFEPNPDDPWFHIHKESKSATRAECQRYWAGYDGKENAVKEYLNAYLEWRRIHNSKGADPARQTIDPLEERKRDNQDWEDAWERTWQHAAQSEFIFPEDPAKKNHKPSTRVYPKQKIPQYIYTYQPPNTDGPLMFQAMMAQLDTSVASAEHHTLAVTLYINSKFNRHNVQQGNMYFDCRGADGWANPTPFHMIPMISTFCHHLLRLHPERLHNIIIYPLPGWAVTIWKMIRKILPTVVEERTHVFAGSDNQYAPAPAKKMVDSGKITNELIGRMEATRKQAMEAAL